MTTTLTSWRNVILLAATCVLLGKCAAVHAQDDPSEDVPKFAAPLGSPIVLVVPEPIGESDLLRYNDHLQLSEAQFGYVKQIHSSYREQCQEIKLRLVNPLWESVAKAKRDATEFPAHFESMMQNVEKIENALKAADSLFFANVMPILSPQQEQHMAGVSLDRARQVYSKKVTRAPSYPEGRIDLVDLALELQIPMNHEAPGSETFESYRRLLVPILIQVSRSNAESAIKDQYLLVKSRTAADHERINLAASRQSMLQSRLMIARKVRDLNMEYVERLAGSLAETDGARLRDEFWRRAYPEIYPDPSQTKAALAILLSIPSLTEDQQALVSRFADEHGAKDSRLCEEMKACVTRWFERRHSGETSVGEKEVFQKDLQALGLQRTMLRNQTLRSITSILTPAQLAELPEVETNVEP